MNDFEIDPSTLRLQLKRSSRAGEVRMGDGTKRIERLARALCVGDGLDVGSGLVPLAGAKSVDVGLAGTGRAEHLPWPDASQDFVYSSHLLEHLADPESALREAGRVLRPGGTLFLYLPFPGHYGWDPSIPNASAYARAEHLWQPHPFDVGRLLLATGFDVPYLEHERDDLFSFVAVGRRR